MTWRERLRRHWKRVLGVAAASLIAIAAGAFLFSWSGIYSVAASEGHLAIVDWFLRFSMKNSVKTHAAGINAPELDDVHLVRLGSAHYYSGCMPCHGGPGHRPNAVFQHSLPSPPDLAGARDEWREEELFWLVKHGIKYTGMPAWSAPDRDDEQWAVVAFLKALPSLSQRDYEELALGGFSKDRIANDEPSKTFGTDIAQCARCHGDVDSPPKSLLVPKIVGQSEDYIRLALEDYASGVRQSGIMQPIATTLSGAQMDAYAKYYAAAKADSATTAPVNGGLGEKLATEGLSERNIPSCESCHGESALGSYPRLAGQSKRYLAQQLHLWRSEVPRDGPLSELMAPIAKRLTDDEIRAVSEYYSRIGPRP